MHHDAAGEIERAQLLQPAAVSPQPVGQRIIDERRPQQGEENIGRKLEALGKRARDQRRRDDGEHHLIGHEQQVRHRHARSRLQANAAQERERQPADDPALVRPESQRVAECHPLQRDQPHGQEAVHIGRQHVLGPHQPAIEEGQARHHQENESG